MCEPMHFSVSVSLRNPLGHCVEAVVVCTVVDDVVNVGIVTEGVISVVGRAVEGNAVVSTTGLSCSQR